MATAQTIIEASYRKCGIPTPSAAQLVDGLELLNNMVSLWGIEFLIHAVTRENLTLTIGTATYTIGSSGSLDTVRPIQIVNVYLRDSDNTDSPIDVISAKDYGDIIQKGTSGKPTRLYYIAEYPQAKIIFDYAPDKAYVVYFEFLKNFTEFATLATTVSLPNEYKEALVYNLAIRLAEDLDVELPASIISIAEGSRALLGIIAAANRLPPKAGFEFNSGKRYNITVDE